MLLADRINAATRKLPAWAMYIVGPVPAVWLFWLGLTGGLGVEPVKALEHELGKIALQLVIAGLAITPLRRFAGVNLIRFRRAVGLLTFFYVVAHFLTWLILDMGMLWAQAWGDIWKRPYVTMGMAGMALMLPLAVTSNNWSVRWLGPPRWQRLHRLVYAAAIAGGVHYVWLVKAWPMEPFLYLAAILALLAARAIPRRRLRARDPGKTGDSAPVA